ncbi:MAG: elongation factor P [Deltaproteobacteria bacterium]|nr:elongation factor P [Deltaproteobacteria bacterium]
MLTANQIRPGMIIEFEGQVYYVMESIHRTPGNLRAFMQVKMRNLRTSTQLEQRFSSFDKVEKVTLDNQKMQYLYQEGDSYFFMNTENYEQVQLNKNELGDSVYFLLPDTLIEVQFYEGKPIGIDLPKSMVLKVVETEPSIKGQSATSSYKPAKLETGLMIKVPQFINEGDMIKVDPLSKEYMERANK